VIYVNELLIAAVSALVGSVVALVWESAIKPRRERSAIASAIAAELLNNAQTMRRYIADRADADSASDPRTLHVSMAVYTALASRLGELRLPDVLLVTQTYDSLARSIAFWDVELSGTKRGSADNNALRAAVDRAQDVELAQLDEEVDVHHQLSLRELADASEFTGIALVAAYGRDRPIFRRKRRMALRMEDLERLMDHATGYTPADVDRIREAIAELTRRRPKWHSGPPDSAA
jgi:hypothetical protein